jgi:glutamine---fructose-6-phosphate transaminase (isomerizing)
MCGIVGYVGRGDAVASVLEGLKRLEYRGYDSSGICFKGEDNSLNLYKKKGKLANLKKVLVGVDHFSHTCIGHTRWATHGEVNDRNAHPHLSDTLTAGEMISIVHNGIVENAKEIRDELIGQGFNFKSETDSEVFLALVRREIRQLGEGESVVMAVCRAFKHIRGNSAFVVQGKEFPELIAVKRGAPLVCGTSDNRDDNLVSSDPYALAGVVNTLFFPHDDTVTVLHNSNDVGIAASVVEFFDLEGKKTTAFDTKKQVIDVTTTDKGDFEHYMLKEIYEQPTLIRSLRDYYFSPEGQEMLKRSQEFRPERVHITACGTAYYAALGIKTFIESIDNIPCQVDLASEFRYRNPLVSDRDLGLFISQSGETADTLAAQELCKERGLHTAAIVNVEGSTLYRKSDNNLLIKAGMEIGVASTKAYTLQVLTGRLFSNAMAGKQLDEVLGKRFLLLADRISDLLAKVDLIKEIAENIYNYKGYFYTGRGKYYPSALEGALKLKEIAYVHAEGYAAGELKHGPIALIDEAMVNIAIIGPELYEKTLSNVEEIKARKGVIVGIGPEGDDGAKETCDHYIPLDFKGLEELSPLYVNVANQLLAYYMAKFKGTDIDKPRNLAKSVTVE